MRIGDAVWLAALEIRSQKLKSGLMMIGVTVAVGFLIALVSILHGTRERMETMFADYNRSNAFSLSSSGGFTNYADYLKRMNAHPPPITESDARAIADRLPAGSRIAPYNGAYGYVVSRAAPKPANAFIQAVGGDYFGILSPELTRGRGFTPVEIAIGAPVTVLNAPAAATLFPGLDPIGRSVILNGVPYAAVGVLAPQEDDQVLGTTNLELMVPIHSPAGRALGPPGEVRSIYVAAVSGADVHLAQEMVREVMRIRHHLRPRTPDDFGFSTGHEFADQIEKETRQFVVAGIVLPSVGLLVGAIVIANIMLVAVVSRTPEIGIRKTVGARRRDVLFQFLAESTAISFLGAAIGVALGVAAPIVVSHFAHGFPSAVVPWSIALGLVLGIVVGIVAGVYPAVRAARLDPVRALRQEM